MTNHPWRKQEPDECGKEGAHPSSLIPVHKLSALDRLYDQQLLRDMAMINERTQRELGPIPPGGLPVILKRKPKSWRHDDSAVFANQESVEDQTMKLNHMAMAAVLSVATVGSLMAHGTSRDPDKTKAAPSTYDTPSTQVHQPDWPNTGIAERELGDGDHTYPQNMFVEYSKGQWHAWVIMTNLHGPAKALDFFSGKVVSAKVENPGEYTESFIDEHGVTHSDNSGLVFDFKDPRPGGALGDDSGIVQFNEGAFRFSDGSSACASLFLDVTRRTKRDYKTIVWSKLPLYQDDSLPTICQGGRWSSLVGTAMDLRDGTMLIAAGKYIFRVRIADLTPVGAAPHLHVVDAADVQQVFDGKTDKDIKDANAYLTEQLHLN